MAGKPKVRVVVNERKIKAMQAADDAGMAAIGQAVLDTARVPDAPPLGQGLVDTGAYVVIRNGKAVKGDAAKPRQLEVGDGATLAVGYDFPGHFLETGTIKMSPHPFVTPAFEQVMPQRARYLREAHKRART